VIPDGFHDFFVASAGVAGALIGLLFVAISVAPERLLAADAQQSHRVRARTALTAFTNALTVSLFALIPDLHIGWTAAIVALVGLFFVAGSLLSLVRVRRSQPDALRDGSFLVGIAVVFVVQLVAGLHLVADHGARGSVTTLCVLVVVCFLAGIARSWELIGGPSIGLRSELVQTLRARDRQGDE
jgi:hypothetical protein